MRNYEDLQVWQKAHDLTLAIYKQTRCFPSDEQFGLTRQMRRSGASIGANIAEGCGRRSDNEMARFVQIAMGSAQSSHITFGSLEIWNCFPKRRLIICARISTK